MFPENQKIEKETENNLRVLIFLFTLIFYQNINDYHNVILTFFNATKIFGPDLQGMRGKTTRSKPSQVRTEYVAIPRHLVTQNKYVCLTADLMFVDGIPFMVTMLRGIKFRTYTNAKYYTTETVFSLCYKNVQQSGFCGTDHTSGQTV